jgi:hypothetical protein
MDHLEKEKGVGTEAGPKAKERRHPTELLCLTRAMVPTVVAVLAIRTSTVIIC